MPFHYLETIMLLNVMPYRSKTLPTPILCSGVRLYVKALHLGSSGWDTGIIRCIYLE